MTFFRYFATGKMSPFEAAETFNSIQLHTRRRPCRPSASPVWIYFTHTATLWYFVVITNIRPSCWHGWLLVIFKKYIIYISLIYKIFMIQSLTWGIIKSLLSELWFLAYTFWKVEWATEAKDRLSSFWVVYWQTGDTFCWHK